MTQRSRFGATTLWHARSTGRAILRPLVNSRCMVFKSGAREAASLIRKTSIRRVVGCLCYKALSEWHLGEIASSDATMAESIALAKELNDMHALAVALHFAAHLAHRERNPAEVESLASELIELSTRQNFAHFLASGEILRGWARSVSGNTAEGLSWIEEGIRDYRATGIDAGPAILSGTKG